ncbi:hypothetical protein BK138_34215 [Paenibacillus rhizosphaerae]|uniref:Uncharacterized protein n=1 Tax=Paenibacillus rhizosphaerae TaxID=297318 RepID=A0A1R1DZP1_9BACL|nr:hypothetical protein BK138_34215 [Paenibacillus rhizosphaerae]
MALLDLPGLLALQVKPTINQIDLSLLQQFYETQLSPNTYIYNLSSGEQIRSNSSPTVFATFWVSKALFKKLYTGLNTKSTKAVLDGII